MTTETLHHLVQGKWFTNLVRDLYWFELERKRTFNFFDDLIPKPTMEQMKSVLNGDAQFIGWTLCNKKGCSQCRGKKQFQLQYKESKMFKKKLSKQKKWLDEYFFTFGSGEIIHFIPKHLVTAWKHALIETKEFAYLRRSKIIAMGYKTRGSDYISKNTLEERRIDVNIALNSIYEYFRLDPDEEYLLGTKHGLLSIELEAFLENEKQKIITEYKQYVKNHRTDLRKSNATDLESSRGFRLLENFTSRS